MNAAPIEPRRKGRARWWLLVVLVFAAHIGLIFALGDRKPVTPRPPAPVPLLSLAAGSDELLELNDPTLFALPHGRGFAGAKWLQAPDVTFKPFRWTESPRLLLLPVEELGATFARFMQTNVPGRFELETRPVPEFTMPVAPEIAPAAPARSTLRLAGDLAGRRLLNPPELRSVSAADFLTNSLAQVLVSANGVVTSAILLPPGCGSKETDQRALELARAARFEPLRNGAERLAVGLMIFEWHTVITPATNAPPAGP